MEVTFLILDIIFTLWVIFLGGAEKIQDTFIGYFEFGLFADNHNYIRALAVVGLAAYLIIFFI